jgi:hypothetical protein
MKSCLIAGALAVCQFVICASAWAFQNEPNGFGGIVWGTPLTAVQGQLQPAGMTKGGDAIYVRSEEDMQFGVVALSTISYIFHDGLFIAAVLKSLSAAGSPYLVKEALTLNYGKGEGDSDSSVWLGQTGAVLLKCYGDSYCDIIIHRANSGVNLYKQSLPNIYRDDPFPKSGNPA